jgi:hypothetical protein
VYLIEFVLFAMVCVLFFLLSPKTIPKTGVKTIAPNPSKVDLATIFFNQILLIFALLK